MADPTCTACAQPVDLAVPHRTLIEQRETEQDGVVAVLAVVDEPRYRHDECPADGPRGSDLDVWEIPSIPGDRTEAWTEDQDTGEPVRWTAVPMLAGYPISVSGRLWETSAAVPQRGGRFMDSELLELGPVYGQDPGASPSALGECPECGQDVPATLAPGVPVPDSAEEDQRAARMLRDVIRDADDRNEAPFPVGAVVNVLDTCARLRAELAETRAAGEALDDVLGALLRELAPIPWALYEDATVARDQYQPREARP